MRLLHGLGQHVAARQLEGAALVAGVGLHHHHVGDLLGGLERHGPLLLGGDVEAAELQPRRALADAEVDAAVGDEVEHGDRLGRARGVVVVGDHLADAVAEPDALGARGGGGEEHLGGRAVRVLLEEVVLDGPGVVEAEAVGELDLRERVLHELALVVGAPRRGQLQLVEDAEFHVRFRSLRPPSWTRRRRRRWRSRAARRERCRRSTMRLPVITTMPAGHRPAALDGEVGEPGQRAHGVVGLADQPPPCRCASSTPRMPLRSEPAGGALAAPMTMPPFQALSAISDSALLDL